MVLPPRIWRVSILRSTVAIMRYVTDLHTGRVSPVLFHFGLEAKQFDAAEFLRKARQPSRNPLRNHVFTRAKGH